MKKSFSVPNTTISNSLSKKTPMPTVFTILFSAVLVASTAAVFVRMAQNLGIPSLTIAAGRLVLASILLTPFAVSHWIRKKPRIERFELMLSLLSGIFLAIHFGSWITSLQYTSVASSAALVSTGPLWVWVASMLFLKEPFHARRIPGVVLSLAGSACIGMSDRGVPDLRAGSSPLLGDALALLGAVSVSGYWLIGRFLRNRMPFLTYIDLCYLSAATVLLVTAAVMETAMDLPIRGLVLIAALAIGPQLFSHSALNWSLKHVSATFVALAVLGEPVGSSFLAYIVFHEPMKTLQLAGFALLLIGIFDAVRAEFSPDIRTDS